VIAVARATFDAPLRARARQLYDDGLSCNAIAKELGFAPSTISRWAAKEKLPFDREQTALAVRAHTVDLAASRMLLAQKLMLVAHEDVDGLNAPHLVYNFGGKDNTYEEHTLPRAPVDVRAKVVQLSSTAITAATKILEKDTGGLDDALGVLDALAGNMHAAAELLRAQEETPADGS
jgi:hypothetical protein